MKRNWLTGSWLIAAVAAGGVAISSGVWAQSADTDVVDSQTEALDRILEATGRAINLDTLIGEPATYQEVLRDPDNIELNLRFARTQINQGNFRGAGATLQRILLIAPNLEPIQLLYAVVLFRQGNLDEAERELKKLAKLDLPGGIRADVEAYLESIKRKRQRTRYTASVSLGGQLDSNRNAAPQSNTSLFLDTPVRVDRPESDFGYIGFGSIRVDHDLGFQEGHSVFAELSYFQDEQTGVSSQDLQSFMAEGGGVYRDWFEGGDLTAKLLFNQIRLSHETLLHEYGGAVRYDRELYTDLTGFIGADLSHKSFSPITENPTSEERNGRQVSGSVGIAYTITPEHQIKADYLLTDTNAKGAVPAGGAFVEEFFSFQRQQARLFHTWLLGDGQFLFNSFIYQRDRYDDQDSFISTRKRRDNIIRLRITYGAPLSFLVGKEGWMGDQGISLWEAFEDITFTPSIEFTRAQSNLQNFDFNNWKTQALFTKSWSF